MAFVEKRKNTLVYMQSTIIPFTHAFSTRYGGVSTGELSSLNFGVTRGDDPKNVLENYRRFCEIFGKDENSTCITNQTHTNTVLTVTEKNIHKCLQDDVKQGIDGLVTGVKGLPVCCFTADCVPALLADFEEHAVAAVHCGWKGSVADILGNTVEEMCRLGAKPENICCALGPSIGKCCFETDKDVPEEISRYLSGDTDGLWVADSRGKYLVDLRAANKRRLIQLGLKESNIDVSDECTFCSHEKYWSHRYTLKHGMMRGNLGSMIMLE